MRPALFIGACFRFAQVDRGGGQQGFCRVHPDTVILRKKLALERSESARPTGRHSSAPAVLGFDAIYAEWYDEVARWVRALGGPEADRDDLVQEVFLVVHRRLPEFDGKNVGAWLYRIARRKVRDFRRLLWVSSWFGRSVPLGEQLVDDAATPEDELEAKHAQRALDDLLRCLNPDQRATFVLFEIEGYSGEEIARLQGVSPNTVWARIHRARKRLQARIANDPEIARRLKRS